MVRESGWRVALGQGDAEREKVEFGADGFEQPGVEQGADALGLPGRTDGEFAQSHEAFGAGAFGDLVEQAGAEPVRPNGADAVAAATGAADTARERTTQHLLTMRLEHLREQSAARTETDAAFAPGSPSPTPPRSNWTPSTARPS
ncbi:hypothetical protein ACFWNG_08480 [Streptomyces sp. NPDC058391]|uniref:hypothetical protein n=1 Tax=Streptomyces sp. NPDC058391 TaxID=3346476 RepID=UPI00364FBE48